jgi:amidase
MMTGFLSLSAIQLGMLIRQRAISSRELVQLHLDRIAAVNPSLNAAVEVWADSALAAAAEVDRRGGSGDPLGPFAGVPLTIKDSIQVKGAVCSAGTIGLANSRPAEEDATLVARLRAAGAIPIASTNLPDLLFSFECDNLIHGRTNNPFDPTRTSGGSSGGEAALIAAHGSPFGLGSDAAGSVRLPAHFCGIASLKPTSGRLARTGHVPAAGGWLEMIWQIGPMARRVEDLCAMMSVMAGPDGRDHTVVDAPYRDPGDVSMRGLRVAFFTDNGIRAADAETAGVVSAAADSLARAGAEVEERMGQRRPPGIEQSYDLEMKMIGPDGGDGLRQYLEAIGSARVHPLLEQWLVRLEPYRTTLAGFAGYWASLYEFRAKLHAFFQNYDVIVSPVYPSPALPHGASTTDENFPGFSYTMTYNLTGWPAAVVRFGTSADGLPIGVQIAAHPWREDHALAVALHLDRAYANLPA